MWLIIKHKVEEIQLCHFVLFAADNNNETESKEDNRIKRSKEQLEKTFDFECLFRSLVTIDE